jgi:hypothetical protein
MLAGDAEGRSDEIEPAGRVRVVEVPVNHLTFHDPLDAVQQITFVIGQAVLHKRQEIDKTQDEDNKMRPAGPFAY